MKSQKQIERIDANWNILKHYWSRINSQNLRTRGMYKSIVQRYYILAIELSATFKEFNDISLLYAKEARCAKLLMEYIDISNTIDRWKCIPIVIKTMKWKEKKIDLTNQIERLLNKQSGIKLK